MKKYNQISVLLFAITALASPATADAASLLEIYQQALQSDPQIHEAEARRLAALEAKPQARSVYLPQISLDGSYTKSERSIPITNFQFDRIVWHSQPEQQHITFFGF